LQMGRLDVVIPPDILSEESSDDGVALEGGTVRLRCKATGLPEPSVVWRREDSRSIILRHDTGREREGKSIVRISVYVNSINNKRTNVIIFNNRHLHKVSCDGQHTTSINEDRGKGGGVALLTVSQPREYSWRRRRRVSSLHSLSIHSTIHFLT
jgi:hypothetical protein